MSDSLLQFVGRARTDFSFKIWVVNIFLYIHDNGSMPKQNAHKALNIHIDCPGVSCTCDFSGYQPTQFSQ